MRERVCGIADEGAADGPGQIRLHQELGLGGLELRTVEGRWLHQLSDGEARGLADAIAAAGLTVPVVDTPVGGWSVSVATDLRTEIDVLTRTARRAAWYGCRRLRVMSYPNDGRPEPAWRDEALRRMRALAAVAADLDVILLHENCQGWAGRDAASTLELLAALDRPQLRLIFDVGNGLTYGYDALPFLRAVLPWVEHVHIKDGHRAPGGHVVYDLPGDGEAQVAGCLALLERSGYAGWYSLEPHLAHVPHLGVSADPGRREAAYRGHVLRFLDLLLTVP